MTPSQTAALNALRNGPLTIHDVMLRIGYPATYPRTVTILRRLEEAHLVRRIKEPRAQGQVFKLTQDGRDALTPPDEPPA